MVGTIDSIQSLGRELCTILSSSRKANRSLQRVYILPQSRCTTRQRSTPPVLATPLPSSMAVPISIMALRTLAIILFVLALASPPLLVLSTPAFLFILLAIIITPPSFPVMISVPVVSAIAPPVLLPAPLPLVVFIISPPPALSSLVLVLSTFFFLLLPLKLHLILLPLIFLLPLLRLLLSKHLSSLLIPKQNRVINNRLLPALSPRCLSPSAHLLRNSSLLLRSNTKQSRSALRYSSLDLLRAFVQPNAVAVLPAHAAQHRSAKLLDMNARVVLQCRHIWRFSNVILESVLFRQSRNHQFRLLRPAK